jgi:hypothetical protein
MTHSSARPRSSWLTLLRKRFLAWLKKYADDYSDAIVHENLSRLSDTELKYRDLSQDSIALDVGRWGRTGIQPPFSSYSRPSETLSGRPGREPRPPGRKCRWSDRSGQDAQGKRLQLLPPKPAALPCCSIPTHVLTPPNPCVFVSAVLEARMAEEVAGRFQDAVNATVGGLLCSKIL